MPKATSVLFGIEDEFDVVSVDRADSGQVKIIIEMLSREGPCPGCGVFSRRVKDRSLVRIQDLRACGQRVQLWWRKRRLVCLEALCRRRSFTQESRAIRPRARVTERLREQVARAIASSTGRSPTSPPSTGCRGGPRTRRWSPPQPAGSAFVEVNVVRPATVICDVRRVGAPP